MDRLTLLVSAAVCQYLTTSHARNNCFSRDKITTTSSPTASIYTVLNLRTQILTRIIVSNSCDLLSSATRTRSSAH